MRIVARSFLVFFSLSAAAVVPRVGSVENLNPATCTESLKTSVELVEEIYPEIKIQLEEHWRRTRTNSYSGYGDYDSIFACDVCPQFAGLASRLLNAKLPEGFWVPLTVSTNRFAFLSGHYYVYSANYDLIVDGTYKQFIGFLDDKKDLILRDLNKLEVEILPDIFVGTPKQYMRLMLDVGFPCKDVRRLMKPIFEWRGGTYLDLVEQSMVEDLSCSAL